MESIMVEATLQLILISLNDFQKNIVFQLQKNVMFSTIDFIQEIFPKLKQ